MAGRLQGAVRPKDRRLPVFIEGGSPWRRTLIPRLHRASAAFGSRVVDPDFQSIYFDWLVSVHLSAKPRIELIEVREQMGLSRFDISDRGEDSFVLVPGPHAEQEGSVPICSRLG